MVKNMFLYIFSLMLEFSVFFKIVFVVDIISEMKKVFDFSAK